MDPQIALLLVILSLGLVAFALDWFSAEVTALGVLLVLVVTGLVPAARAFDGFGSDTVMTMLGLLILTAALTETGVADAAGRLMLRGEATDLGPLLVRVTLISLVLSAVLGNTASTAFLLPVVLGVARRAEVSPSRLLMPMAFATILASSLTLVSTSTNIVLSGMLEDSGRPPLGMLELTPVGLPIALVGLVYLLTIGRRLVPVRREAETDELDLDQQRLYLADLLIPSDSPLVGQRLADSGLEDELRVRVLRLVRDGALIKPQPSTTLQAEDELLVEGRRHSVLEVRDREGVTIESDYRFSDPSLDTEDMQLIELLLMPGSPAVGSTLREQQFGSRYGLIVLAIDRRGETLRGTLDDLRLEAGDVLLAQGDRQRVRAVAERDDLRVLDTIEWQQRGRRARWLALGIFAAALAAATLGLLSLPVAMLGGAVLVFVTRTITPEEAYEILQWRVLILIGSVLGFGVAMEHTGAAQFLAEQLVVLTAGADPRWLLTGFFTLTVLLTQPMSNQAAAAVVFPVAVQAAEQLGLNPRTFTVMIAVAASTSFLTPLEPAALLVYGPGQYRFLDFLKAGLLLTLLIYGVAIVLVPWLWPL